MENISRGPTFGYLSLSASRRRCRTSQLQDYTVREYRLPSPPSFKCNVLRESLSVDSQNIPCATLKRGGSWVTSVYLWTGCYSIHYLCTLQNSFKPLLPQKGKGGRSKIHQQGDCEQQGGKLLRLLSQLRPGIRPLFKTE